MKPAPTNPNGRNTTRNTNIGNCYSIKQEHRYQAIKTAENTPDEIKNTNIKYLLKR